MVRLGNLWGLPLLVLLGIGLWYAFRKKEVIRPPFIPLGVFAFLRSIRRDWRDRLLGTLKFLTLILLGIALLRPQLGKGYREITSKVVDIMLVLDISGSMLALDMGGQTRIDAAKEEAIRFVEGRKGDRIGLVLFASKTFLQCPLTVDHELVKRLISMAQVGLIEDGTAIGSAIITAVNHMKDVPSKSKVIVLLTDGVNNTGKIDPITAAKIAKRLGIKIYTIGVGSDKELVPFLIPNGVFGQRISQARTELDEGLLREIAKITGGKYFRVKDREGMRRVFKEIDSMEKHEVKERKFYLYKDVFPILLKCTLVLLLVEVLLENLVWITVP